MTTRRDVMIGGACLVGAALPCTRLAIAAFCVLVAGSAAAKGPKEGTANAGDKASPIFGVTIPADYRRWELIAPSQETGRLDELRGILGNDIALKAYREGTLPFPDGAKLAKLAWKHVPSAEFEGAFVPGGATTVQIMSRTRRTTRLPAAGDSGASSTACRSTRRSTGRVSRATRPT